MGYTHYWRQYRAFSDAEWATILAESKRIAAKAQRGEYYAGKEDFASATKMETTDMGFRVGFNEEYAWRTFPHPDQAIPMQGAAITLAGTDGTGLPEFTDKDIAFNGKAPEDYESFVLERAPELNRESKAGKPESFAFTKTEYRPYDAVVVSILFVAQKIAPDAIKAISDGGDEVIKMMF